MYLKYPILVKYQSRIIKALVI